MKLHINVEKEEPVNLTIAKGHNQSGGCAAVVVAQWLDDAAVVVSGWPAVVVVVVTRSGAEV